jgi:hypothetical protein
LLRYRAQRGHLFLQRGDLRVQRRVPAIARDTFP